MERKKYLSYFKENYKLLKKMKFKGNSQTFVLKLGLSVTNNTYFSFTLDVLNQRGTDIGGGASHDVMVKIMPELKKYIDLHLSDQDGTPMYALENGFYYLQNPGEYKTEVVMNHFRIDKSEAKRLQDGVADGSLTKEDIAIYVDQQKPRWRQEANKAISWIKSLDDSNLGKTSVKW